MLRLSQKTKVDKKEPKQSTDHDRTLERARQIASFSNGRRVFMGDLLAGKRDMPNFITH